MFREIERSRDCVLGGEGTLGFDIVVDMLEQKQIKYSILDPDGGEFVPVCSVPTLFACGCIFCGISAIKRALGY